MSITYEVVKSFKCNDCQMFKVGERIHHTTTSINEAYHKAENYNSDKRCGCRCEVREVKE